MVDSITYSLLGTNGALGNQLWQIAGTYGKALDAGALPRFPTWFYQPYFRVPDDFFTLPTEGESTDLGDDYLQDLRHWQGLEADVRSMFRPSELSLDLMCEIYPMNLCNFTGVHVRRGNNMTAQYASHHPSPPLEYFEKAIDELPQKLPLWVFSDDLEWCKNQSIFKDAQFGQGPPPGVDIMDLTKYGPLGTREAVIDLLLLSECQQHVISNSSFSWWAAWLAGRRVVSYPAVWYGEPLKHIDTECMFSRLGWEKVSW